MFLAAPPIFGNIATPPISGFQSLTGTSGGLLAFVSRIIIIFYILAGLYVLLNIIIAGYLYIQGGTQNTAAAWAKIWQSLLGLIIVASAILLTAVVSWFIFGDPAFILKPTIITP